MQSFTFQYFTQHPKSSKKITNQIKHEINLNWIMKVQILKADTLIGSQMPNLKIYSNMIKKTNYKLKINLIERWEENKEREA